MNVFRPSIISMLTAAVLIGVISPHHLARAEEPLSAQDGSIEGRILHPAHVVQPIRICAIGSGQPARHSCIETRRNQGRYRIDGLEPDDYVVIAAGGDDFYRVGAHVMQVQCISAPCPEMPVTVHIEPGTHASNIDINGFYQQRDDFPPMPVE